MTPQELTIARRTALTLLADTLDAGAPSAEASRTALAILAEELHTLAGPSVSSTPSCPDCKPTSTTCGWTPQTAIRTRIDDVVEQES
jgi:hypothetical protein